MAKYFLIGPILLVLVIIVIVIVIGRGRGKERLAIGVAVSRDFHTGSEISQVSCPTYEIKLIIRNTGRKDITFGSVSLVFINDEGTCITYLYRSDLEKPLLALSSKSLKQLATALGIPLPDEPSSDKPVSPAFLLAPGQDISLEVSTDGFTNDLIQSKSGEDSALRFVVGLLDGREKTVLYGPYETVLPPLDELPEKRGQEALSTI